MEFPTFLFRFAVLGVRSTLGGFSLYSLASLSVRARFLTVAAFARIEGSAAVRADVVVAHSLLTPRAIWGSTLKSRTAQ